MKSSPARPNWSPIRGWPPISTAYPTPGLIPTRLSEEEEEELSGILVEYDMRKEEIVPGMRAFQHKVSFRKNLIYTVVLAVLTVSCITRRCCATRIMISARCWARCACLSF